MSNTTENKIPDNLKKYGKSSKGNFEIIDTIANPHPYCLTPKHVKEASDNFIGMMGKEAILSAEKKGIFCYTCKEANRRLGDPILKYEEHKHGLLVACYVDMNKTKKTKAECKKYLLSVKEMCEKDGYAGFVFLRRF